MAQFHPSDNETAQRIANGDRASIEEFIALHYACVYRFLLNLTRQREDAEDLTQLTFIKARQNMRSYKGNGTLKAWLYKIALYEFTHWKRKQRYTETLRDEIPDKGNNIEISLEANLVLTALESIPRPLQVAFLLHEVQELSIKEIASIQHVPQGTVKSRLFHARKKLTQFLNLVPHTSQSAKAEENIETPKEPAYES